MEMRVMCRTNGLLAKLPGDLAVGETDALGVKTDRYCLKVASVKSKKKRIGRHHFDRGRAPLPPSGAAATPRGRTHEEPSSHSWNTPLDGHVTNGRNSPPAPKQVGGNP